MKDILNNLVTIFICVVWFAGVYVFFILSNPNIYIWGTMELRRKFYPVRYHIGAMFIVFGVMCRALGNIALLYFFK